MGPDEIDYEQLEQERAIWPWLDDESMADNEENYGEDNY